MARMTINNKKMTTALSCLSSGRLVEDFLQLLQT